MPDIFNRKTDTFGGSFSADSATMTFPALGKAGGADIGLLTQSLQTSYRQQVTRLYEVGSPAIYYVGGRTSGDCSFSRIIGPRALTKTFYSQYGDICNAGENELAFTATTNCDTQQAGQASYTCKFCVLVSIGLGVGAQDMLINEGLQMMFSSFAYDTSGAATAPAPGGILGGL